MSGNSIIRFNLKWNYGKTNYRNRRFKDVKDEPKLVEWILTRPEPYGQMKDLAKYLLISRTSTTVLGTDHAVVYRLRADSSTERQLVDADEMSALIEKHGKQHAQAGGLRCEMGHRMKFVGGYEKKMEPLCARTSAT